MSALNEWERTHQVMDHLDPALLEAMDAPRTKRRPRPVRAGLIAACVCIALFGTSFAAKYISELNVTAPQTVQRPNGEVISWYSVQGGVTKFPIDALTDELRDFAAEQMRLPVTKDCATWSEAEKFVGIEVANNSLLDQLEPSGGAIGYYGKMYEYHCGVTIEGRCDEPNTVTLRVNYSLPNDTTSIGVQTEVFMDSSYSQVTDAEVRHLFKSQKSVVVEQYVTLDGLIATIATIPDDGKDFICQCQAHFVLNGMRFQVTARDQSPARAMESLKQVLDAYECPP